MWTWVCLVVESRGGGHGYGAGVLVDREGVAGVAGGDGPCDRVVVPGIGEVDDRRGGGGGLGDRAGVVICNNRANVLYIDGDYLNIGLIVVGSQYVEEYEVVTS